MFRSLYIIIVLITIQWLGVWKVNAQDGNDQKLPPLEMLQKEPGEVANIFQLQDSGAYKIFDQKGALVDSGSGEFIDFTDYDPGIYFITSDSGTERYMKTPAPINQLSQEEPPLGDHSGSSNLLLIVVGVILMIGGTATFLAVRLRRANKEKTELLKEIRRITSEQAPPQEEKVFGHQEIHLDKEKIEAKINAKLNESDWKIVSVLIENPSISNNALAQEVSLSVEGTRSALKKMYRLLEVPSSRNMRLTLALELAKISRTEN